MQWTGLNEIREKYLHFFETKEHLRLPSFPLIPQGDKSILLINAGMTPMKKYFTGEITPPAKRVTTCQKCIRTPDIESVGITARHGTYFEMLGNFSFGDYFKREATAWAKEFFTEVMEMPLDRLYFTVYEEDDEAWDIWTKEHGIAEDHMLRLGKKDNFWEHGAGPCGPCSEIHFDRGEKYGCGKPDCGVECECDRWVEIWNLVFTQFENDGNGNYTRLAHPNIDTGMGLERLACVMQDVDNIFEVDTIRKIMEHVMQISGVTYHTDSKKDMSLRVVTDHIRSTTMMISDGVLPSNEGRGYVLRRLLRRAARHGRLLGIERPFLTEVCETVIAENEGAYPVLREKHDYIIKIIATEEESFSRTIDAGMKMLDEMIANGDGKTLSGEDAFRLSDTYGFPIDLTKEILAEKNISVDEEAFRALVKKQRETARAARKDAGADAWKNAGVALNDIPATVFTGYTATEDDSKVLGIVMNGERAEVAEADSEAVLVLDKTAFYAESGGQVGDTGVITGDGFVFNVTNTTKTPTGIFLHAGFVQEGTVTANTEVKTSVDAAKRASTERNHTSAHLLQYALRTVLGTHVEQAGSYVSPDEVRFDFTHFSALTAEEITKVEQLVNEQILSAKAVLTDEMSIEDAKKIGAMALFGEKYGDTVRVVRAGDSTELCGGTHVKNTGNIGLFKIVSESSVASGVRRITGVTGFNTYAYLNRTLETVHAAAAALKLGNANDLVNKVTAVAADLKNKEREIDKLKADLAQAKAADIFTVAGEINGIQIVTANLGETDVNTLRTMLDSAKNDDCVAVLAGINSEKGSVSFACAAGKNAVAKGAHAGNIVRAVAQIAGGAGGGKPDSAMAGGKDITKTDEALAAVLGIAQGMIK
ncbi:MAG: alanine--tRNA ligase [Ruminococcaceae bacterium]|nr:alanine--tRNA ligase [Oscillospiraceae bacterium]